MGIGTMAEKSQQPASNTSTGFLRGRPRAFWTEVIASRRTAAVAAPIVQLESFDLSEIMDDLHYGTDCEWAA